MANTINIYNKASGAYVEIGGGKSLTSGRSESTFVKWLVIPSYREVEYGAEFKTDIPYGEWYLLSGLLSSQGQGADLYVDPSLSGYSVWTASEESDVEGDCIVFSALIPYGTRSPQSDASIYALGFVDITWLFYAVENEIRMKVKYAGYQMTPAVMAQSMSNLVPGQVLGVTESKDFGFLDVSSSAVGITSVEQTTTSTADGGENVITVTKTDGTSSTFKVKNGSKGSTGPAYTLTDSDKSTIVNAVVAALPKYTGGVS